MQTMDPRWNQFLQNPWKCSSCDEEHIGIFDLGFAKPEQWQGSETPLPNSALADSTNILTEDFCILDGEHYFVRCILELPLQGLSGERFAFGVWSTLSKANFEIYCESFDSGEQGRLGPWFGWFSNRISGYPDTLNMKCQVHPQAKRMPPSIELQPIHHRLVSESQDGISFDRLAEIYSLLGHTMPKTKSQ